MLLAAWYHTILSFLFAVVCLLLLLVILLQRGRGVGLAGAFGGAGGSGGAFGSKTGDFLTWVTVVGAGIYLVFAVILNYVFVPPAPAIAPPPAPAAPAGETPPTESAPTDGRRLIEPRWDSVAPRAAEPVFVRHIVFGEPDGA
ncbi:MAG: preprotein translocase subunit SecG [Phycisphaerae bacterium]